MFPIRDHNPSLRTPFVTYGLIALNLLVFFSYFGQLSNPLMGGTIFVNYGAIPAEISAGQDLFTLLTAMFLHGGLMHLGGNMLFLYVFGDNLEDVLGHLPFLGFYLVGGLIASLAHVLADPASPVPMVGASGAIAAVLGGYLLLYPKARVDVLFIIIILIRIIPIPAFIVLGVWFGLQILNGATASPGGGGVAYWAHAGGFVAGLVLILPVWLAKGGPVYWTRTGGHPDHPEARYRSSRSRVPVVRRKRR